MFFPHVTVDHVEMVNRHQVIFTNHICQEDRVSDSLSPLRDQDSLNSHRCFTLYIKALLKHLESAALISYQRKHLHMLPMNLNNKPTCNTHAVINTHINPPSTSPTDTSIPAAPNWLSTKAPICRGILVEKKKKKKKWQRLI